MKKSTLTAAIMVATLATTSVLSVNVMAADWFVGGSAGAGFNDMSAKGSADIKDPDGPVKYGIQVGAHLNDNVRIYGTYTYGDDDAKRNGVKTEMEEQQFLASVDYLFGTGNLKPFVGLTVGIDNTEFKVGGENGFSDDDTAFAYGAQAGVLFSIKSWDMEAGYRQLWHDNEVGKNGMKLENSNDGNAYAAISYRF
ncbi:outer membrane beta-barrel protein [Endozoicomonas sp.]|uniref:outer membrane beta-barrel protein n=1 Tax=Endozoicomonas sp. TaxID=1892382 RepID=UPI002886A317|nr:porin family protein [Endozoicomonas sp.]